MSNEDPYSLQDSDSPTSVDTPPKGRKPKVKFNKDFSFEEYFVRSPREYLLMLRERWFYGILPAAAVAFLVIFMEFKKPELYETSASLHFETKAKDPLPGMNVVDTRISDVELNNHLEWIKSSQFFKYFYAFLTEDQIRRYQAAYRDPNDPSSNPPSVESIVRGNLNVRVRSDTTIAQIRVRHRDPEIAAEIANLMATRYINFNLDKDQTDTNSAIIFLNNQVSKLQRDVELSKNNLAAYRSKYNLATLGDDQNLIKSRVQSLNGQIIAAELEHFSLKSQVAEVQRYIDQGKDLIDLPVIRNYGEIPELRSELNDLEKEMAVLEQKYLERHPMVIKNQETQDSVRQFLREEVDEAVKTLETNYRLAAERETDLTSQLKDAEAKLMELDRISVTYELMENDADTLEKKYRVVQDRLTEANISSKLENTNISVFDPAWVPFKPVEPNMPKAILQGSFLAILLLFAIPIMFGIFDFKLKSSWDIETTLGSDLIGEIPKITKIKKDLRFHAVSKGDHQPTSEAFRGIYSQILLRTESKFPRTIMVTSTIPNEGKSLVSNNLAQTFATHGKRTLLLDGDFRRPSIGKEYPEFSHKGALHWLKDKNLDEAALDELIAHISPNLFVLKTGGAVKEPTAMFETHRFAQLMQLLKSRFDVIIVDTPPVGIFPDGMMLNLFMDELLYVCRFNKISKHRLRSMMERVMNLDCTLLGTILNGVPSGISSKYYGYYGYGSHSDKEYTRYYKTTNKKQNAIGRDPANANRSL